MAEMQSSQPQYNIIWRAPEAEVFELCREAGISKIVWSPLAQGVLTGKRCRSRTRRGRCSASRWAT